ncbi:hypothetical protein BGC07_00835 [Piscirickettsia litoralis]|uniref:Uncharacterized protein n=2 Tax=Piscirickettsia litoralis TaxID=1891921 RepID=A0ABX3A6Q7_9GAMM|nr:hypothetical protein BGC07_00835 [Piscirickettsia litoralis]
MERLKKDPDGTKTRTGYAFQLFKEYHGSVSHECFKKMYDYGRKNQWGGRWEKMHNKKSAQWDSINLFYNYIEDKENKEGRAWHIANELGIKRPLNGQ